MVNIQIDGALNVNNTYGDVLPSPSPDAVQEFTIQTSVPPARYMNMGVGRPWRFWWYLPRQLGPPRRQKSADSCRRFPSRKGFPP
jgi:hypothetical protein